MSIRSAVAARLDPLIAESCRSRARELIESGALDRAAQIAELAHSLTDAAVSAMGAEWSRRRARRTTRRPSIPPRRRVRANCPEHIIGRLEKKGQ